MWCHSRALKCLMSRSTSERATGFWGSRYFCISPVPPLPESTTGVKGVKDILLESEFGFQAKNVQDALEEMELVTSAPAPPARAPA